MGIDVRASKQVPDMMKVVDAAGPMLMESDSELVRLPSGEKPSWLWDGDHARGLLSVGLSKGDVKASLSAVSGVRVPEGDKPEDLRLRAFGGASYMGLQQEGVKPLDWRGGAAEVSPGRVRGVGVEPDEAGGFSWKWGQVEGKGGHLTNEELQASRERLQGSDVEDHFLKWFDHGEVVG